MAESGKSKWFHKLGPKPSSKHLNGIIGPVQHIRLFRDFRFLDVRKTKIAEKSYVLNWTYRFHFDVLRQVWALIYETTLIFPIRPSDKILKFSITREYSSFEHQFPGKQDLIRENGLRIRTQRGQITLGYIAVFQCFSINFNMTDCIGKTLGKYAEYCNGYP